MFDIHPSSEVHTKNIGDKTVVWQYCIILEHAVIGQNCNINSHVFVENDVKVGNNVTVKSGVQLWDGVTLEDDVFIGPNVTFTNDLVPRSKIHKPYFAKTLVRKGASIGANSTIIAGNTIGENALIGAGSTVTKDIPANTVWFGTPAIFRGTIDKEGNIKYEDLL
ncbi:acyltransferase [Pedobacter sp. Leaf250]|uniref:acyltransferase n=1 Tax=Pedobacter sp. Leaf250 TaxID=2876559 RepID=UPI001E2D6341|nr:acyltransferase [Pedobacter sp. Leaf250]